eukprot:3400511-Lingulodinium_polyedra.AAC.1
MVRACSVESWYSGCNLARAAQVPCICSTAVVDHGMSPMRATRRATSCMLRPACSRCQIFEVASSSGWPPALSFARFSKMSPRHK